MTGRRESKRGGDGAEELGDWRPLCLEGLHEGLQALWSLPWQIGGLWISVAPHALRLILEGFKTVQKNQSSSFFQFPF